MVLERLTRASLGCSMTASAPQWKLSYAEYVSREELSAIKHEFIDGEIYAMSGGTPEHAALIGAVTVHLGSQLLGGPCRPFTTELRTRVRSDDSGPDVGTYPDIAVVCGRVVRDVEDTNSIVNPTLIIEVLSRSTEAYDRAGKFGHYKRLESLHEYVLVSSRGAPRIERFAKRGGLWIGDADIAGIDSRIVLSSVPATLDVNAIYQGLLNEQGQIEV
jgi:Uma2 family endonuclease